jgi:hypothetical protein
MLKLLVHTFRPYKLNPSHRASKSVLIAIVNDKFPHLISKPVLLTNILSGQPGVDSVIHNIRGKTQHFAGCSADFYSL